MTPTASDGMDCDRAHLGDVDDLDPDNARLHHAIIESFIDTGRAPRVGDLSRILDATVPDVEAGLRSLEEAHGVVLHPGRTEIWVAHPFSAAPTGFVVRSGSRVWWAPCAWCALGVAALVGGDVEIVTALGATSDQVRVRIAGGRLLDNDFCVHFPVPMRRAWDNVIYTCSTMLLFRSESDVDAWGARHGIARGDVQPVRKVWDLARVWYGSHRSRTWRKWSTEEASDMFRELGLTGDIWDLDPSGGRF